MAKKKDDDEKLLKEIASQTDGALLGDREDIKYFIDTGNLALNYMCSGKFLDGGIPGGKLTECFGPSSSGKSLLATNILRGCQKMGGLSGILDCENATDVEFMEKAGKLDCNKVLRYCPPTIKRCFSVMCAAITKIREHKSIEIPIAFVYDSIGVSPSEREYAEIGEKPADMTPADWRKLQKRKEQPGERAKEAGAGLRKINSIIDKCNATVFIINQIRDMVGVMYGCFYGNSKVWLADGSVRKIKDIVNNKESVEVLSFNFKNNKVEFKKVIGWHDNGLLEEGDNFLKIKFKRETKNAYGFITCTKNHIIFRKNNEKIEEVHADEIQTNDDVLLCQPYYLNKKQMQVVYGSLLGDGSVYNRYEYVGSKSWLRFNHGLAQEDYMNFKINLLKNVQRSEIKYHGSGKAVYVDTIPLFEINHLSNYRKDGLIPQEVADNLDELGLAIWYLDDGTYSGNHKIWGKGKCCICCKKFKNREIMFSAFKRMGLECTLNDKGFIFNSENTEKLHSIIARFVPESMSYKIHEKFHGLFGFDFEIPNDITWKLIEGKVLEVDSLKTKLRRKYDLTIEDNANYFVGGALVHNSPETTAGGGKALPFYASCRLRIQTQKNIVHASHGAIVGVNLKIKNKKNRAFRPFIEIEGVKLYFDSGIDPLSGLLKLLVQEGRILDLKRNSYQVANDFLPDGESEYKFKVKAEDNSVPMQVVLDCPKIIGCKSKEEVENYLSQFSAAIATSASGDFVEKSVHANVDEMLDEEIDAVEEESEDME